MKKSDIPKDKSIRRAEIVSRLYADDGTVLFDVDKAMAVIQEKNNIIKYYAYIIHDKDVYEKDSEAHKKGTLKPPHIHLLLSFEQNQPQKLKYVAQWFGVPENFVSIIKGSWDAACLYQIHFNAKDKYQYDVSEVKSNFDYEAFIKKARKKDETQQKQSEIIPYIEKILSGEIREYNKTLEIPGIILVNYQRKIDNAFKVRSEYLQATQKERHTECIYIKGFSGVGKTSLAKKIADGKGFVYFVSSGSNDIMDGYGQEPCIILDDIRPSCLGLSDLLKMLDPHTASSVKSRYKNKYLNCDLLILTTVLDIDTFYGNVFENEREPITQLKRRCSTYIQMDKEEIWVQVWDRKAMRYSEPVIYKNTVLQEYIPENYVTKEDVRAHIGNLIPFLKPENSEMPSVSNFHLQKICEEKNSLSDTTIGDAEFYMLLDNKTTREE